MGDIRPAPVADQSARPSAERRAPIAGTVSLVFAVGALFFPRFLVMLPILVAVSLAALSFFRRESLIALPILALAAALGVFLLAASPNSGPNLGSTNIAALEDIETGKETAGSVHSDYQFVCFDEGDALRGEMIGGYDERTSKIRDALMDQGRCGLTGQNATYDMTADGKEQFTTPHGVVELWAAHE